MGLKKGPAQRPHSHCADEFIIIVICQTHRWIDRHHSLYLAQDTCRQTAPRRSFLNKIAG